MVGWISVGWVRRIIGLLHFGTAQYVCTIGIAVRACDNSLLSGPLRVRLSAA